MAILDLVQIHLLPMNATMAIAAKRYQVLFGVLAGVTTEPFVMNLKVGRRPACLASPSITSEHSIAKLLV